MHVSFMTIRMFCNFIPEGGLWLCPNTTRNRRGNNDFDHSHRKCVKGLNDSSLEFAPLTMERYFCGPLGITTSNIAWPGTVIWSQGIPEYYTRKLEQNRKEDNLV